ncbi:MAG: hypothetical protein MNPFHGCM_02299 [Gemmatimonadaceae bacterium]|nr:hypothetical protein [Gemmatimonadaceae bacterium]
MTAGRALRALAAAGFVGSVPAVHAQPSPEPHFVSVAAPESDTVPPAMAREFRGVWIATVDNIDWPSRPGLPVDSQQTELLALLDRAAALRLNAVIFQVRPSADAMYASSLEPWSYFLTGQQGRAPQPAWDPLAFAVDEAHKRSLELHAWFNPYRARHPAEKGTVSPRHVSRARPGVVRRYGKYLWMDPGEPWVRTRTTQVILDVVRRYDVDGVHIDDYFYPYPEVTRRRREIPFPDASSYKRYRDRGGKESRDDWRRDNVNRLVDTLYREIKKQKPWVKFGVSPFGIWRPGYPASVRGFDAYQRLYADSRLWINKGWMDYLTPQLYWQLSAPEQSYGELLAWWRNENTVARHIWPGNYTSRVAGEGGKTWAPREIVEQVRITREGASAPGNVHFSMRAFMVDSGGVAERLAEGPYREPALVPASPWLSPDLPLPPTVALASQGDRARLTIVSVDSPMEEAIARGQSPVARIPATSRSPRWWTVRVMVDGGWRMAIVDARQRELALPTGTDGAGPTRVLVSAVDRVGNESPAVSLRIE